jgi:hypothetical protein
VALAMRTMFAAYLAVTVAGLAFFLAVGLAHG